MVPQTSNFAFLSAHDAQLVQLGALAERYFRDDPVTAIFKLRQFAELLSKMIAAHHALLDERDTFEETLRRLFYDRIVPKEAADIFHTLRKLGNAAAHETRGNHSDALAALKLARQLGVWFHRTYGKKPDFKPGPFIPPPSRLIRRRRAQGSSSARDDDAPRTSCQSITDRRLYGSRPVRPGLSYARSGHAGRGASVRCAIVHRHGLHSNRPGQRHGTGDGAARGPGRRTDLRVTAAAHGPGTDRAGRSEPRMTRRWPARCRHRASKPLPPSNPASLFYPLKRSPRAPRRMRELPRP